MLKELIKEMLRDELKPVNTVEKNATEQGLWVIVILQRGWIVVGKYYEDGVECKLEDASVIRRWGTTKGLGELALNGPLSDTKLEKSGTIRFNKGAEVCRMDCKTTNW